jgi:small subunit ribosomal protein S1
MIDEVLIASLGIDEGEADSLIRDALGEDVAQGNMDPLLGEAMGDLSADKILTGKVIGMAGDDVVVEVGLKSEGLIPKDEFETSRTSRSATEVDVLLESMEGEGGLIQL